ncbi:hypothetical protein [Leptospira sp. GIMC2001]|uniref:hypothetical protein n=1 Tax=Leptospira sp. GIMC2001 TaxID=1513297 RepID=UPI00234B2F1C|nr:hypothetical protein [Leptospira sp. GIMC2001]WCL47642.1 hypothetical protein O4O04_01355 [Leptospira sp. GIMC2001]
MSILVFFAIILHSNTKAQSSQFSQKIANNKNSLTLTTKPLLRIWPAFRPEECDWAIRKFICLRCLRNQKSYAQIIEFNQDDEPTRIHGCYSKSLGFEAIEEGRDHPVLHENGNN